MHKRLLVSGFALCLTNLFCIAQYVTTGKIQFERRINLKKQSTELSYQENLKRNNFQFKTDIFELYFNNQASVYNLNRADDKIKFFNVPALNNKVFQNFRTQTVIIKKEIFGESFILKDSIYKIQWKYTGELREIAGYECKKAEAVIFDSIYLVAFYAEQISVPAGPESVHGLPGMILGLAIPRLNTTWFATKVELIDVDLRSFKQPTKGVVTNRQSLKAILDANSSSWGPNAHRYLIWSII